MSFTITEKEQKLMREWKISAVSTLNIYIDAIDSHRMITDENKKVETPMIHVELLKEIKKQSTVGVL